MRRRFLQTSFWTSATKEATLQGTKVTHTPILRWWVHLRSNCSFLHSKLAANGEAMPMTGTEVRRRKLPQSTFDTMRAQNGSGATLLLVYPLGRTQGCGDGIHAERRRITHRTAKLSSASQTWQASRHAFQRSAMATPSQCATIGILVDRLEF